MRTLAFSSLLATLLVLVGCGDDGGATDTGTGSDTGTATDTGTAADTGTATDTGTGSDAAADAASDATADAAPDATSDGGSCSACIAAELSWGNTGGLVASSRASKVSPCRTYTLTETDFSAGGTTTTCSNDVPCGSAADAITIDDVNAALADADVVAAFAAAPVTYGVDMRPVDGSVFQVSQSGATFVVGSPCGSAGSCTPIPAGVQALVDLLRALDAERLAEPDCSTVFP